MDHRTVPLEVLREFVRSYAELTSLRTVAEDAGVGRSTVHSFVTTGNKPHPRVRRMLALWYLRRVEGFDELELLRPYIRALEMFAGDVATSVREDIALDVVRSVVSRYNEVGQDAPLWTGAMQARIRRTRPVV